jgi:hypothetical protein
MNKRQRKKLMKMDLGQDGWMVMLHVRNRIKDDLLKSLDMSLPATAENIEKVKSIVLSTLESLDEYFFT